MSVIPISKALKMVHLNEGSHSFTCHQSTYLWMEWANLPLIPSRSASPHCGWYSFPVQQRIGGWVSWPGRLVTCGDGVPIRRWSWIPVPADR